MTTSGSGEEVQDGAGESDPRGPSLTGSPGNEVLWTAVTALLVATLGYLALPGLIKMTGRSGRIESVEWALYLLLGAGFPVVAVATAWLATRASPRNARIGGVVAAALLAALVLRFFWILGPAAAGLAVLLGLIVIGVWLRSSGRERPLLEKHWLVALAFAATAAWAAVFGLASWTDAAGWITQSIATPILIVAAAALCAIVLAGSRTTESRAQFRFRWIDAPAVILLVVLSFRTNPIVEFYHWSFWVGPMESIRQGGWLLWDVPSQYGFLSILLPSLVPTADAWQALYGAQAVLYLVTALALYAAISSLRPGITARVVALAFTATALFFRPRDLSMILPAQMTPAGGPMRFFWCYVILGVLLWRHVRADKVSDRKFALAGTAVWVASVAWSSESAIYSTVAWGAAYTVFLAQRFFARSGTLRRRAGSLLAGILLPLAALGAAAGVLSVVYNLRDGHPPDWQSFYEYAILFSAGYSSLPVETAGSVWYLVSVYIVVSAIVVGFLLREPRGSRLLVAVGAWGTIWGISSYFVSRSHPVNLLSLVPLIVFALVLSLRMLGPSSSDRWGGMLRLVSVPLLAMPIVLTLAHAGFAELFFARQTAPKSLTVQVPAMDPDLAQLAANAGMRPDDPVFFVSDGRYVLPRWPELVSGQAQINSLAWAPKPYEMINTLTTARRDTYIARFQDRVEPAGWLVQKKEFVDSAYFGLLKVMDLKSEPVQRFENDDWILIRYRARDRR